MDSNQDISTIEQGNSTNTTMSTPKKNVPQTYYAIGSPESGFMEIDLVASREKNVEYRYLSISFIDPVEENGITENQENKPRGHLFIIDNKEAFDDLKRFFTQLEWNS